MDVQQLLTEGHLHVGVAELLVFHPVDTVAKRLMSNKAKVMLKSSLPSIPQLILLLGLVLRTQQYHLP